MATTVIVAETLIIGLQTTLWLVLLVTIGFGVPSMAAADVKDWEVVIGLYVVAVAYTLGILFDRLAAFCLRPIENKFWSFVQGTGRWLVHLSKPASLPNVDALRMQIRMKSSNIADEIDDIRRPLRITRATVINLIIVVALLVISLNNPAQHIISAQVTAGIARFSAAFCMIAVAAYVVLEIQYYRRLVRACEVVELGNISPRDEA